jgi:Holliday junction resolvase-like predicted endonuclease
MRLRDMLGRLRRRAAAEHRVPAGVGIGDWDDRCAGGELDVVAAERRALACGVKTRRWVLAQGLTFGGLRVDVARVFRSWLGDFMLGHLSGVG